MGPAHFVRQPSLNPCRCLDVKRGIAHHTTLTDITPANLELGLDQCEESGPGGR